MTDHDELRRHLAEISRLNRCQRDEIEALRAALAARPEPVSILACGCRYLLATCERHAPAAAGLATPEKDT